MDRMRAPTWLYALAAGKLVMAAYLVSARGSFYELFFAVQTIVIVTYLFAVNYLMNHLRRFHTAAWLSLGRPSFPTMAEHTANPWQFVQSGFLTMQFTFSAGYKSLEDERLNQQIWLIRVLLVGGAASMIVLATSQTG